MFKDSGKPFACTNGQFTAVVVRITSSLPAALQESNLDIKDILESTKEGTKLAMAIAKAFKNLYSEYSATMRIPTKSTIRRLVKCLFMPACDGTETLANATDVFDWISPNFKNLGTTDSGKATEATGVAVYKLAKDATFAQMFRSIEADLDKLYLTQHQIKTFREEYPTWLRVDNDKTFFLYKKDEKKPATPDNLSIAGIYMPEHLWDINDYDFKDDNLWCAENQHRIVVQTDALPIASF